MPYNPATHTRIAVHLSHATVERLLASGRARGCNNLALAALVKTAVESWTHSSPGSKGTRGAAASLAEEALGERVRALELEIEHLRTELDRRPSHTVSSPPPRAAEALPTQAPTESELRPVIAPQHCFD